MKCQVCKGSGWMIIGVDMIESINNKEPCENCKGTGEVPDKVEEGE